MRSSHALGHLISRYQDKPLLRILDSYVLDVIDQLCDDQRRGFEELRPTLARSLGLNGSWQEMVSAAMQLPESMPESIRRIWSGYSTRRAQPSTLLTRTYPSRSSAAPTFWILRRRRAMFTSLYRPTAEVRHDHPVCIGQRVASMLGPGRVGSQPGVQDAASLASGVDDRGDAL